MSQITPDRPQFAVAMRGYDRVQVDEYVERLNEWARDWKERAREAEAGSRRAARQLDELTQRLDEMEDDDPEGGPRSIKALGERVGAILKEAYAAADDLRLQAETRAEAARTEAAAEVDRLRLEAEELRTQAAADVDRLRAEADEMRSNGLGVAQAEAASMRAEAREDAERICREATAEAAAILEAARSDAERITAAAQSELRSLVELRDSVIRHLADLHRQLAGALGTGMSGMGEPVDLRDRAPAVDGSGAGEQPDDITIMIPTISS